MLQHIKHAVRVAHSLFREHVVKRFTRSPKWSKVRKEHLKANPMCAACGTTKLVQVHHKISVSAAKRENKDYLELEPTNLISLCMYKEMDCHLLIGHGSEFRFFNPRVEEHVKIVKKDPSKRGTIVKLAKECRVLDEQ